MFTKTSRYQGIAIAELTEGGRVVRYACRRILPLPGRRSMVAEHVIEERDRLDRLAARYLGDPELYWRLCDANGVMHPGELEPWCAFGRQIRVPTPHGG